MEIKTLDYNGNSIQFELKNGVVMANATMMAKPFNKLVANWRNTEQIERYINKLSEAIAIPIAELITIENGNGTWIHEKLILKLAQWLNVDFELWCDDQIANLLKKGTISLPPKSRLELAKENVLLIEEIIAKDELIAIQTPKVLAFEKVIDNKTTYTLASLADISGLGRGVVTVKLREFGWLKAVNSIGTESTQYAKDMGYAKTTFSKESNGNKYKQFVLFRKGIDRFLIKIT